ncbi:MAG: protein translocase subunit SecF, partial [Lachnospiraceae bacterium]
PGIAGIILSIGMAVDANVIIFARIREELGTGKTVRSAIDIGFKKALSAILDGNITTLIAALVLIWFGTGSVKGFAITLAIGIVLSMLTALVITRLILKALYGIGLRSEKLYGAARERKTVDFLKRKALFFGVSAALIVAGIVGMIAFKAQGKGSLNYGLEFAGGTTITVPMNEEYTLERVNKEIVPEVEKVIGSGDIQTQTVKGTTDVIIKTRTLNSAERTELETVLRDTFDIAEDKEIGQDTIGATISNEMRRNAVISVAIATLCMLLYIFIRFRDFRFATSAVVALLHDVLVVLAFYALFRVSVGNTFIACMLTIVGYSINATIVIFDRIRENMKSMTKKDDLKEVVNKSITQTLTRSIYTSFTTFVMVLVLFIMGVNSIRLFALPLMVGIVCGAYSSVCITGALWYVMKKRIGAGKTK